MSNLIFKKEDRKYLITIGTTTVHPGCSGEDISIYINGTFVGCFTETDTTICFMGDKKASGRNTIGTYYACGFDKDNL